jgi:hypothetical protein
MTATAAASTQPAPRGGSFLRLRLAQNEGDTNAATTVQELIQYNVEF